MFSVHLQLLKTHKTKLICSRFRYVQDRLSIRIELKSYEVELTKRVEINVFIEVTKKHPAIRFTKFEYTLDHAHLPADKN